MKKHLLFLTGIPGVGKTTILLKTVEALRARGYSVGGMISREVRVGGTRVGFEILDLSSDKHGWLAHVNQRIGPQIGKYRVNLDDLESVGVKAILRALKDCDVVALDEIGPMEFFSEKFRETVKKAVESQKLVICTVHWRMKDKLIDDMKRRENIEIITVTHENRNKLLESIVEKSIEFLKHS